jgi:hypothetical protein
MHTSQPVTIQTTPSQIASPKTNVTDISHESVSKKTILTHKNIPIQIGSEKTVTPPVETTSGVGGASMKEPDLSKPKK